MRKTGDGAGILTQIPEKLFQKELAKTRSALGHNDGSGCWHDFSAGVR